MNVFFSTLSAIDIDKSHLEAFEGPFIKKKESAFGGLYGRD